jgi:phage shock protein C
MAKRKKLYRGGDRVLGGVCSGMADYFETDTTLVRVIAVLLTVFTALVPGIIAYILCWIIIPQR